MGFALFLLSGPESGVPGEDLPNLEQMVALLVIVANFLVEVCLNLGEERRAVGTPGETGVVEDHI